MRNSDRRGPRLELRRETLRRLTAAELAAVAGASQKCMLTQPSQTCLG